VFLAVLFLVNVTPTVKHTSASQLNNQVSVKGPEAKSAGPKPQEAAIATPQTVQPVQPAPQPAPPPPLYPPGSHEDWMNQAGISSADFAAVDYIVTHESGWNYQAVNYLGATGLCQALPGSKMASAGDDYLTNPVTQLKWCSAYAASAYGGWWPAQTFWANHHWW